VALRRTHATLLQFSCSGRTGDPGAYGGEVATAHDDDPGLPIKWQPVSNGEFVAPPATSLVREAVRRSREALDDGARRVGWSR